MKPASLMDATDATEAKEKGCFRNFPLLSFTFCFSLLLSVLAVPVFSQVPGVTHYQGSLRDKSGNPINASLPMTLSIYDTPTVGTGTQLWTENQTVGVSNGVFSISVGAVNPIPESVFASSSTYLEVDINGETPSAREQLLSGAYSFHSSVADYALTVSPEIAVSTIDASASTPFGGVNITTSVFVQGSVGISSVPTSGNLFVVGAGTLTVTQAGKVGIGTANPTSTLTVAGVIQSATGGIEFPDGTIQTSTNLSSTFVTTSVTNGASGWFEADCPSGWIRTGCTTDCSGATSYATHPTAANGCESLCNQAVNATVYAICVQIQ